MPRAQASSQQCFLPERDNSRKFGFALALNDDYLAVGDPKANRVVLYSRQANGSWSRTQEILPPSDSAAAKVGEGFGYDLALDGSLLVIGAYVEKYKSLNPERFQWTSQLGVSYSGGVYRVPLDSPAEVEHIYTIAEGEMAGSSVAAGNGKIAFGIAVEGPGRWTFRIVLLESDLEQFVPPINDRVALRAGGDIDIHNDLLLVGTGSDNARGAVLFDLKVPYSPPRGFVIPDSQIGNVVAISDGFAVVSRLGFGLPYPAPPPGKTLIVNIKYGYTTVIDGYGDLSLDGNLLVRVYRGSDDGELPAKLELFDLSDAAGPSLIARRWGRYRAEIHNGMLATVQETRFGSRLCIEQGIQ